MPSVFPFTTKKSTSRRPLVQVRCDESSVAASTGDDKSDHPETLDEDECSSHNVEESVEAQDEVNVQLQVATDEIAKLKQMLDEARLEIFELRKNVARKRLELNWFENLTRMSIFILGYHLLLFLTDSWST